MSTVLIVDDALELAEAVAMVLSLQGYSVELAESREDALHTIRAFQPEVVLMDLYMPGMSAKDFLSSIHNDSIRSEVILCTGGENGLRTARELGLKHYLQKPFNVDQLIRLVRDCSDLAIAESGSPV